VAISPILNSAKPSRLDSDRFPTLPPQVGRRKPLVRIKRWLRRVAVSLAGSAELLIASLKIRPPDTRHVLQRIQRMERDLVLPIKVAVSGLLLYSLYFTHWLVDASTIFELPREYARYFLWVWVCVNVVMGWVLLSMGRLRPKLVELAVFLDTLVDGIFLGVLTLVTGGYNSILYWVFLALIARSAVSVPRATSQLLLSSALSTCYVLAGVIDSLIASRVTEAERQVLELYSATNAEPLLLRLALLLLMTFGCYAIQVLLERQRQVEEEAREFAVREVQLRSAGRLAAEFAHQIKNPLAIINNAAFSLQKALREGKVKAEQIDMIQEEVDHADRIVTQVMGYAQLSEGHVEKLNVLEELDHAIELVFPPAANFPIRVVKECAGTFPPLLMQRRHAAETFMNVLQNARDALEGRSGEVRIAAQCWPDQSIAVSISDDGPGIPPDKLGRIFEAYYTTKERGTGLGLATVKHNVELYGGRVMVESELGKGARFTLIFPAKTLLNTEKIS
jgi:signal transduction histidine kinase